MSDQETVKENETNVEVTSEKNTKVIHPALLGSYNGSNVVMEYNKSKKQYVVTVAGLFIYASFNYDVCYQKLTDMGVIWQPIVKK